MCTLPFCLRDLVAGVTQDYATPGVSPAGKSKSRNTANATSPPACVSGSRSTSPRHPQLNGMVELDSGRTNEIVNPTRSGSATELECTNGNYVKIIPNIPQSPLIQHHTDSDAQ